MWRAEPNAGHRALAELERRAALHTLVTQNVDGLHQLAGSSPERIVEIHGTVHRCMCMSCAWEGPMDDTLARVRAGEADPACLDCGGILKSATISFGQNLVVEDLERSQRAAAESDLFLALGHVARRLPRGRIARGRARERRPPRHRQRGRRRRSTAPPSACSASSSATCSPRWSSWSESQPAAAAATAAPTMPASFSSCAGTISARVWMKPKNFSDFLLTPPPTMNRSGFSSFSSVRK